MPRIGGSQKSFDLSKMHGHGGSSEGAGVQNGSARGMYRTVVKVDEGDGDKSPDLLDELTLPPPPTDFSDSPQSPNGSDDYNYLQDLFRPNGKLHNHNNNNTEVSLKFPYQLIANGLVTNGQHPDGNGLTENGHSPAKKNRPKEFFMSEHENTGENDGPDKKKDAEKHPFFVSGRDVRNPDTLREFKIVSQRGTVRGFKNRVRAGIATFLDQETKPNVKNYRALEQDQIILYTTSMRIVRETYEKCMRVKNILQTHMVTYDEVDVFMSKENQKELLERLGGGHQVDVPQVFADGMHLGDADTLEEMNETGELRRIFKHFKKVSKSTSCDFCGGYRYIPCVTCHGSKKSLHRNHFTEEFCALRCIACDENGLIRCDKCDPSELQQKELQDKEKQLQKEEQEPVQNTQDMKQ